MGIILSQDKVNIFNLAKNAGTSVEQIERFYARNLPLSPELAKNLQSFGESKRKAELDVGMTVHLKRHQPGMTYQRCVRIVGRTSSRRSWSDTQVRRRRVRLPK